MPTTDISKITLVTQILAGLALLLVLKLGLLAALLAGLLVYQLVEFGAGMFKPLGILPRVGKIILILLIALLVISLMTYGIIESASRVTQGPESLVALLQRMADVVESGRSHLPDWAQNYLPANINEWQAVASSGLRENARHLSVIGREAGVFLVHIIIGMVIGGMVALNPVNPIPEAPMARAMAQRVIFLGSAFRRIVFSQVRISALNTFLTAIFLVVILPMVGSPLPLTKTMIVVTFIAGLLPIVGNLISNTVIVLIALSVSPGTAVAALVFLVVVHKLEYFVNARIIGSQIRARAWELLIAMLVMESAFGISGLVAAPIYYAFLKDELAAKKLI